MRSTFWTTFGQSPQWDKVLWQGAHFGPLGQSPQWDTVLQQGAHYWTTFGWSPQWDKVLWQGASSVCHIWQMPVAWQVLQWGASFSGHIWLKSTAWLVLQGGANFLFMPNGGNTSCSIFDTYHSSFTFWMPIAWASQPTPPSWPLFPRGPISRELPTKFSSLTISWIFWLGASKPIPYLLLGLSIRDLYVPNSFMPLRPISTLPATPLPSLVTLPTKWASSVWSRSMSHPFVPFIKSRRRQLWMPISTTEMTCPWTGYPKLIGKILRIPLLVLLFPTSPSLILGKFYPMATSVTMKLRQNLFIWAPDTNYGPTLPMILSKTGRHPQCHGGNQNTWIHQEVPRLDSGC